MKCLELHDLITERDFPYLTSKERQKLIGSLSRSIQLHESQMQRPDGKRIQQDSQLNVKSRIKHLRSALRCRLHHEDPKIRRLAGKLVHALLRGSTFTELSDAASRFRGELNESGYWINDRTEQERSRFFNATKNIQLQEVRSTKLYVKLKNELKAPLGDDRAVRGYMGYIRDGQAETWAIYPLGELVGLLNLRIETWQNAREITCCNSYQIEPLYLSQDEALDVLRCLDISCVGDAETFYNVGAFPEFLQENIRTPFPCPFPFEEKWYYIWRTVDRIIVAYTKQDPSGQECVDTSAMNWSYLKATSRGWKGTFQSYLSVEMVLILLLSSSKNRQVFWDIRGRGTPKKSVSATNTMYS